MKHPSTSFISEISPTEAGFADYEASGEHLMKECSKVNLLIGSNNSGKSRFLRSLFLSNVIIADWRASIDYHLSLGESRDLMEGFK